MEIKTYQIYKLKNVKYIFSIEKDKEINYTLDVYEYICSKNMRREHELLKEHIGTELENKYLENEFMRKYETHTEKRKNRIRGFNELNEVIFTKKSKKEQWSDYYKKNREKILLKNRNYYYSDISRQRERKKIYYNKNKDKIRIKQLAYQREKTNCEYCNKIYCKGYINKHRKKCELKPFI